MLHTSLSYSQAHNELCHANLTVYSSQHSSVVANLLQSYTHRVHLVRSTDVSVLPEILEAGEGTTHLDREMLAPRLLDIFQEHWRGEGGIKRKREAERVTLEL